MFYTCWNDTVNTVNVGISAIMSTQFPAHDSRSVNTLASHGFSCGIMALISHYCLIHPDLRPRAKYRMKLIHCCLHSSLLKLYVKIKLGEFPSLLGGRFFILWSVSQLGEGASFLLLLPKIAGCVDFLMQGSQNFVHSNILKTFECKYMLYTAHKY